MGGREKLKSSSRKAVVSAKHGTSSREISNSTEDKASASNSEIDPYDFEEVLASEPVHPIQDSTCTGGSPILFLSFIHADRCHCLCINIIMTCHALQIHKVQSHLRLITDINIERWGEYVLLATGLQTMVG